MRLKNNKYALYGILFFLSYLAQNLAESAVVVENPPWTPNSNSLALSSQPKRQNYSPEIVSELNQQVTSVSKNNSTNQMPKLKKHETKTTKYGTDNISTNTTHNNQGLVDRSSHETSSQSTLATLYNYLNNNNSSNFDPFSLAGRERTIPLGKEYEPANTIKQHHGQESVPTDFILTAPGIGPIAELPSQLYGQQLMIPGAANQQEQVLASFYTNGYANNNQQIVGPDMRDAPQMLSGTNPGPMYGGQYYQTYQQDTMKRNRANKKSPKSDKGTKQQNMLTNDQIASLIEELKDYNSRQASKIRSNIVAEQPENKESNEENQQNENDEDDQDDNLDTSATRNTNNDNETKRIKKTRMKKTKEPTLDANDLAKFAKFLMSKEGSDVKSKLGMDRDIADDNSEDFRDVLLESKRKIAKSTPKKTAKSELEDMDKKHTEVENQMDKLIADMSNSLKQNQIDRMKQRRKNIKQYDDDDTELNDRKRRDNATKSEVNDSVKKKPESTPKIESLGSKPEPDKEQNENFAKMLIRKEILEDKQEGSGDLQADEEPKLKKPKRRRKYKRKKVNQLNTKDGVKMQQSPSISKVTSGQQDIKTDKYVYERPERKLDQLTIIDELQKSRDKKSRLRNRLPITSSSSSPSILKRALNGEMAFQTQIYPDGTLMLKANKDNVLKLKLPKKKSKQERSVATDKNDINSSSSETDSSKAQNGDDEKNQVEKVQFQSPQSVQDEYPVSDRVSDRLNKLSNNIDRLFKDGFLQEVDSKSRFKGSGADNKDHHESSSSNINESPATKNDNMEKIKIDHDFDVNVSIDGKRDVEPDPDEEADPEPDEKDETEDGDDPKKKITTRKKQSNRISNTKESQNSPTKVQPEDGEDRRAHLRREETSRKEKIEFENVGALLPPLDPVDSETLDTPIGPDRDNIDANLKSSSSGTKRTEESNSETRYGKNIGNKFYEEPQWR